MTSQSIGTQTSNQPTRVILTDPDRYNAEYATKYERYKTQISGKEDYLYYKDLLVSQGWKPDHLKNLTLPEMKQLTCHAREFDLDTLLAFSDYPTLYKFASENYGLRSRLSRKDLVSYIRKESLLKGEAFLSNSLATSDKIIPAIKQELPVTPIKIEQNDRDNEIITEYNPILTQADIAELCSVAVPPPPPLPANPPVGSGRFLGLF